jgi:hypothetical protein
VIQGVDSIDMGSQIASLEIAPADGGFHLLYFDANGNCVADTWHETEAQAKAQARPNSSSKIGRTRMPMRDAAAA